MMQEQSSSRLSFQCSSRPVEVHFNQRWHIANFKCLADLSSPGEKYISPRFWDPCLKDMAWYMSFYPSGDNEDDSDPELDYCPSLYLFLESLTDPPTSVMASYRVASIADDDKETVVFSDSFHKYTGGDGGWGGGPDMAVKVHRKDGSLLLDCTVTALIYADRAGIDGHGALCNTGLLSHHVPSLACILSNVAFISQEWHILDVRKYISNSQPGDKIEGQEFRHSSLEDARWSLQFYPNGKDEETKGNLSLYLHLDHVCKRQSIKVKAKFKFIAVLENGTQKTITDVLIHEFQSNDFSNDNNSFGIDKCFNANLLRKDGSLLLKCDVSMLICEPRKANISSAPPGLAIQGQPEKKVDRRLQDRMSKMVDSGYASDFVIKVGYTEFPVHRAILGCCSDVFRAMLDSCLEEAKSSEMIISDFSTEAVRLMIRCIYVGTLPDEELSCHVKELVALADKYELEDLKEICEEKICENLVSQNVLDSILLADTYNLSLVKDACINLFRPFVTNPSSEAWARLKADHPRLAVEILERAGAGTEMCPSAPKRCRF